VIERTPLHRPRVSRETRQLLATALVAVVALWVLARVRFPDRPPTPNPVPALLTQLAPGPAFGDLASEIAQLQGRLVPSLLALRVDTGAGSNRVTAALRIRDDAALALLPLPVSIDVHLSAGGSPTGSNEPVSGPAPGQVVAFDPATGLTIARVSAAPAPGAVPWRPQQIDQPRFLVATTVSRTAVSLRPSFVASMQRGTAPAWPGDIWLLPGDTDLMPGALVFSNEGEFAGLVIAHGEGRAIVPSEIVLVEAMRLLERPIRPRGRLGVEVQALTPALSHATGASAGVVVSWVDPEGPAAGQLAVGDVIDAVDGRALESRQYWDARTARLGAGDAVTMRVQRQGKPEAVSLLAAPVERPPSPMPLGLTLRRVGRVGSEVVDVEPQSAARAAGIEPGDRITMIGDVRNPTPAQIEGGFAAVAPGQRVLIAITRGDAHRVATLGR
jgi:hypothetical protein